MDNDNATQVSEQINSAVNSALGVGALAAIYTGNFVNFGKVGGALALIAKTITENGVYRAENDGADGYSVVTVDTPTGVQILTGEEQPTNDIGENGQIYLKTGYTSATNWTCRNEEYLVSDANSSLGSNLVKLYDGQAIAITFHQGVGTQYERYYPVLIATESNNTLYKREGGLTTNNIYSGNIDGTTWYLNPRDPNNTMAVADAIFPVVEDNGLFGVDFPAFIRSILDLAGVYFPEPTTIVGAYAKVDGEWNHLIGTDVNDITLGGE